MISLPMESGMHELTANLPNQIGFDGTQQPVTTFMAKIPEPIHASPGL